VLRARLARRPVAAPALGVLAGAGLVVAVFLPWYAASIGETFRPGSASGWEATGLAKLVLALGIVVALASLLLSADARDALELDVRTAQGLGAAVLGGSVVAGALVLYRMLVLPEPSDLLTRQIGLWAGIAAAAAGTAAGASLLAART
jgi:hypothetical protein